VKIVITGVLGYVAPSVVRRLRRRYPNAELVGFDSGFFAHNVTASGPVPEVLLDRLHFGDIRDFPSDLLQNTNAVVHLAAISNDPMGSRFEAVTEAINQKASVNLAERANAQGVNHFVLASSCSIYGFAEGRARCESDTLNPLTAYARSKVAAEHALRRNSEQMVVTCLRFATACGMSDRLRLDLVRNDFVASALETGEIKISSDGAPWRPLIDVQDMARAIEWAIVRDEDHGGRYLAINVGANECNYQIRDLANAAASALPGTGVSVNSHAPPDKRSYQVDFSLFGQARTGPSAASAARAIGRKSPRSLRAAGFADGEFRSSSLVRLRALERHIAEGLLSDDLCDGDDLWQVGSKQGRVKMKFHPTPLPGIRMKVFILVPPR
jgi:nucleoside-diphosphate-sugar epimerase